MRASNLFRASKLFYEDKVFCEFALAKSFCEDRFIKHVLRVWNPKNLLRVWIGNFFFRALFVHSPLRVLIVVGQVCQKVTSLLLIPYRESSKVFHAQYKAKLCPIVLVQGT